MTLTFLTSFSTNGLSERYSAALKNIAEAERSAGVTAGSTELIIVSKNHPADLVLELMQLGAFQFGENRDQEASTKSQLVAEAIEKARGENTWDAPSASWNFIGQLQSNKVKSVLRYASSIHSLDRESLLSAIVKEQAKAAESQAAEASQSAEGHPLSVFIELNLTGQAERGGILPENLIAFAELVLAAPGLKLEGVMGVAGLDVAPEYDFDRIFSASQQLQSIAPSASYISAGMSGDYEIAIRHGATHVRIGTAITGKRDYSV